MIVARSDYPVEDDLREKIALFCDVERRAVIPLVTAPVLYEVPLVLERFGVGDYLLERLGLQAAPQARLERMGAPGRRGAPPEAKRERSPGGEICRAADAYLSVREALEHAALALGVEVEIDWVHSSDLEKDRGWDVVQQADGILVPGGFGSRGIEGKIKAIRYARENKVPYLGLCLGMQLMVVEFARHLVGSDDPNSTEFDRSTPYPVIDLMPDQRSHRRYGRHDAPGAVSLPACSRHASPARPTSRTWCRSATATASS